MAWRYFARVFSAAPAGAQMRIDPFRSPVATRLASRVSAIESTNPPAVFTSPISAILVATTGATGASWRQPIASAAAPITIGRRRADGALRMPEILRQRSDARRR